MQRGNKTFGNKTCWTKAAVSLNAHKEIYNQTISNVNTRPKEKTNKTECARQIVKSNLQRLQQIEIPNKHIFNCEDKSWELLRLSEMHIKAYANSHTITLSPNFRPLNCTVTLLNLQYTAIAAKDAGRNTERRGR